MVVRIGGREIADNSQIYGSRRSAISPSVMPSGGGNGLLALAGAIGNLGEIGNRYFEVRKAEEEERQNFDALQKWNNFTGTFQRRSEEAKLNAPVDGAGYANTVATEWDTGYKEFLKSIPPRLHPQFEARAADAKQSSLLAADGFTRQQTRTHSQHVVSKVVDEAQKRVYQNPDLDLEEQIAETIMAAPGLTAAEKEGLAEQALQGINGASFGGRLRNGREAAFAVPFSADVGRRVIPAIIKQESGGNPDAVSSAGAIGIMQVMPETALQVARDLGDPNFPYNGSIEEKRAYLKKAEVNKTYGTFYFNQQLKRYNGDIELALVAYNAGPGRADEYLASGRRQDVLPAETKGYIAAILPNVGALTPEMAFDPAFGLSFEQSVAAAGQIDQIRAQAERDAMAAVAQAQQAAADAQDLAMNQLYVRAEAGEDGRAIYVDAIQAGQVQYDRTSMENIIGITKRVNGEVIKTQEAFGKLARGDSLSPENADRIITPDLRAGMLARDENAINSVVARTAAIGFVPPAVERGISQMLYSTDIQQVSAGAQIIRTLQQNNPTLVQGLPEDMIARANSFEHLRSSGMPADELKQYMDSTVTMEQRGMLASLKKGDDQYEENRFIPSSEIANYFDSALPFTGDVALPLDQGSNALLQLQYGEVFDLYYAQTRDANAAKKLTLDHIAKTWGPTDVGGQERLMWLPPEQALTSFFHDVDGDGQAELVRQTPQQAKTSFERAVKVHLGTENFAAFALPGTADALKSGKPVPYGIIPLDEDGQPNYSTEALMQLLSGEPFLYDYNAVRTSMMVLQTNRELLQKDLEALPGDDPRRIDLEAQIHDINKELGE